MRVCDWMTPNVTTIRERTTIQEAVDMMRARKVRHLLVMEHGTLRGVVSQQDLLPHLLERGEVRHIMTKQVLGISSDVSIGRAADLMLRNKIGCLPVLDGETLVGIITQSDILRAVASSNGDAKWIH